MTWSSSVKSDCDWAFESEPQTALLGRRVFTPRGKMLGGSSNINAMMHQWCHPADFDGWVDSGAVGWSWNDVAPVLRAQERWLGDDRGADRGRSGPLVISPNPNASSLSRRFVEAARGAGLGSADRYNGHAYPRARATAGARVRRESGRDRSAIARPIDAAQRQPA